MKKIIAMVFITAVIAAFCGCSRETDSAAFVEEAPTAENIGAKTEPAGSGSAGVPNPIVEYSSLEEINKAAGVNLMKPAVMGVSKERFSVIDGKIAQYVCDINGREWTFRGACVTDEDISGIFDERNVFVPREDYGVYANEFCLDRFFDGDRQYTIVVKDPVSADGEILLDGEAFSNCCMEMRSIQQQHMNDPLVGDYQNTADEKMALYVERRGDEYVMSVNLNVSDSEFKCWTMHGAVRDGDRLTYRGEEIGRYTYDAEGNETSSDVTAANNLGYFEIKDSRLYWTGAAEEECRTSVFEKIVYSDETAIAEEIYLPCEIKLLLDNEAVLDEENFLKESIREAFQTGNDYEGIYVEYLDTAAQDFQNAGWTNRIRLKEGKSKYTLTYKRRFSVPGNDLSSAVADACEGGFTIANAEFPAEVDWGYSKMTLSFSNEYEIKSESPLDITLLERGDAVQMLADHMPPEEKNRNSDSWGTTLIKEAQMAGPVRFMRYSGVFDGYDIRIEIWPIESRGDVEYISEFSAYAEDMDEAAVMHERLISSLDEMGILLPVDALKTRMILDNM